MTDAVVVGAGPNGLVAANLLADAGWSVLVVEAQPEPGGAVRSAELMEPGWCNDLFSAFYPLGVASPVLRELRLEEHGLRWARAPTVMAHPTPDGRCAVLSRNVAATAASVGAYDPADADAWHELSERWAEAEPALLEVLFRPFPAGRGVWRLTRQLGPQGLVAFARLAALPVRRLAEERFRGEGAGLLLAGNALHSDLPPESPMTALLGLLLVGLGQRHGFPAPVGGSGALTAALVARLRSRGGEVVCDSRVTEVLVRAGHAVGVRLADGSEPPAAKAVLADVGAPALLRDLVDAGHLPPGVRAALATFQYDNATVKVDWNLDRPVPWQADGARSAGTVHLADSLDELTVGSTQLAQGLVPERPFLVVGQMTTVDASRSPAGTETLWAYTHVPQEVRGDAGGTLTGRWDAGDAEAMADRMQQRIEQYAPGFASCIRSRVVATPRDMEAADANLVGGAINGGTAQLHQQLVFRPIAGLAGPETPVRRLYLASASAHPGGGVHGACGANAARAALVADRPWRHPVRTTWSAAARRLQTGRASAQDDPL